MRPALLLAALALAACERPAAPAPPPGAAGPPFVGTEWRLAAIDGDSATAPQRVTLSFSDTPWDMIEPGWRAAGGYDGCNDFGVGYRVEPDAVGAEPRRFRTGGGIASNAMACAEPGAHVSDSLHARMAAARSVRLDGGRLTFADSLGAERLAFVPRPVREVDRAALVTGRWRLDPAASTVTNAYGGPAGRYEVAFSGDGSYAGEAGCRTFSGDYALDGDRLRVTSYALDDQACAPDDRHWDGPNGLDAGEVEVDESRLVIYSRLGPRAVFARP